MAKKAREYIKRAQDRVVYLPKGSKKGGKTDKLYSSIYSDLEKALKSLGGKR